MDIRYNVYYSTNATGPWTLANVTPISHIQTGNEYSVTGLSKGGIYYFMVVGGDVESGTFIPLISQAIGPQPINAKGVGGVLTALTVAAKRYIPRIADIGNLNHEFEVI